MTSAPVLQNQDNANDVAKKLLSGRNDSRYDIFPLLQPIIRDDLPRKVEGM